MRNAFTVRKLQQITGVVKEVCETYNVPYHECLTVTVRSKLCTVKTGEKGRATKFDLAREVCSFYDWEYPLNKNGTEIKNAQHKFFNITDAAGMGLYYLKYVGGVEDT